MFMLCWFCTLCIRKREEKLYDKRRVEEDGKGRKEI